MESAVMPAHLIAGGPEVRYEQRHAALCAANKALGALQAVLAGVDGLDGYGLSLTPRQAMEQVRAITAELQAGLDNDEVTR